MSLIIEKISRHAQQYPERPAISTQSEEISFRKLDRMINDLSEFISNQKLTCIGLVADNSLNWALIDLACMKASVCCVPVPEFFSQSQIRHLCKSAGIQAFMGEAVNIDRINMGKRPNSYTGSLEIVMVELEDKPDELDPRLKNAAKVTFTSGSTGDPKGVSLSLDHIERTVLALNSVVKPGTSSRHLSVLPLVTLLENIAGLYLSLVQGANILLYPMHRVGFSNLASLNEKQFFGLLNELRPQSLILVPELLRLLLVGVQKGAVSADEFSFIAVGGGVVSKKLLEQASRLGLPVLQGYGLSECASVVALNDASTNRPGSVGKPLRHVDIKIARDGEILIAGNVMNGYLSEPPVTGDWLASGDLGYMDRDGYLYVTGRKKNLLVTSFGKNISPEWVEGVFQQSPLIRRIMITGDERSSLRAIIVPVASGLDESLQSTISKINQQLPAYARITDYQLVDESLIESSQFMTANGKFRRSAVAAFFG